MSDLIERLVAVAAHIEGIGGERAHDDAEIIRDAVAALVQIDDVDGIPVSPIVSVLADMAASMRLVVANTGHADVIITEDLAMQKWAEVGMRVYPDLAVPFLRALGITVEPS